MDISGPDIADFSRGTLLEQATLLAEAERTAQVGMLELAVEWALANGPETVAERPRRHVWATGTRDYGGVGTPLVTNGAGSDLAARIGRSTYAGDKWIADALDIRFRLPQLNARVVAGEVQVSYARHVAGKTRELSLPAAAYVDSRVAESADGRLPWGRFTDLVDASVIAADPAAAEAKEKAAASQHYAKPTRSNEAGMRGFYLRTDVAGVAKVDATVAYLAQVLKDLGSADDLDTRRARATVLMADPAEATKLLAAYAGWRDRPQDSPEQQDALAADGGLGEPTPAGGEPGGEPGGERGGEPGDERGGDPAGEDDPPAPTPDPDGEGRSIVANAIELWDRCGDGTVFGPKPVINWTRILPTLSLFVHLYAGRFTPSGDSTGSDAEHTSAAAGSGYFDRGDVPELARVEGIGVYTEAWLRAHLQVNPDTKLVVKPVIDLEGQAPVDAWEIPDRHRQAVRLMTPADVFPWGSASTNRADGWSSMQIDHSIPWKPDGGPGQSAIGNYGPLTQFHHNLKTHAGWHYQQPFPGIYIWRDPHGAFYLVDHTGTRPLNTP